MSVVNSVTESAGLATCDCTCEFTATRRAVFYRVVTVEIAEHLLREHNVINRRLSGEVQRRYERDMVAGNWMDSNDDICLSIDGRLLNGQHRLAAIASAGVPQELCFKVGMNPRSQLAMDDHFKRSLDGQIKLSTGDEASPRLAGIVRAMFNGPLAPSKMSNAQGVEFYLQHRDAILFAGDAFGSHKPRLCVAHVMAVCARAWYTADRTRITEFANVIQSGLELNAPPDDHAAVTLRNHLLINSGGSGNGSTARTILYQKTQRALVAFLARDPLERLQCLEVDAFPLPVATRGVPHREPRLTQANMGGGIAARQLRRALKQVPEGQPSERA